MEEIYEGKREKIGGELIEGWNMKLGKGWNMKRRVEI